VPLTNVHLRWSKTTGDNQLDDSETLDLPQDFDIGSAFTHKGQAWVAVEKIDNAKEWGFRRSKSDPGVVFMCDPADARA
jgi:hypothetical protein